MNRSPSLRADCTLFTIVRVQFDRCLLLLNLVAKLDHLGLDVLRRSHPRFERNCSGYKVGGNQHAQPDARQRGGALSESGSAVADGREIHVQLKAQLDLRTGETGS